MSLIGNRTPQYASDMLSLNVWYSLTINPDNKHQYTEYKRDRIEFIYGYFLNYHMIKLSEYSDFILYPEISTPKSDNKKGITRIHYHGKIRFTKSEGIFIWYMYILNNLKNVSMVEIDTINDKETWENYVTKNKNIMLVLCKHAGVRYTMTDECKRHSRIDKIVKGMETVHPINIKIDSENESLLDK